MRHQKLHDHSTTIDRIMALQVGSVVGGKLNGPHGTVYRWQLKELDPDALDQALVTAFGPGVTWEQVGDSIAVTVPKSAIPALVAG